MNASLFLARLIGPVMLTVGIALFLNKRGFAAMADEFLRGRALLFLSGLLIMPAGIAIVLTHNVWVLNWPLLITLLGWMLAIGGAIRILGPEQVESMGRGFLRHPMGMNIAGAIWVVIGAVLCLFGYVLH
jgi:hypothetical protein